MEYMKSVTEYAHITQMQDNLRRKLAEAKGKDLGRIDSLRSTVLSSVVYESYDRAIMEMKAYVENKASYPLFQERSERYMQHCENLILAIETKRNFPGLSGLALAKQQEIHDKVLEHFEDLKRHLKLIEKIEREQKVRDVRTTVWVVQAVVIGVTAITLTGFFIDAKKGMFNSAVPVVDFYLDSAANWVVNLVHL